MPGFIRFDFFTAAGVPRAGGRDSVERIAVSPQAGEGHDDH